MDSPVTTMETKAPARSPTTIESFAGRNVLTHPGASGGEELARRRLLMARLALLCVALGVTVPTPVSSLWGAAPAREAVWVIALVGLVWAALLAGSRAIGRRAGLGSVAGARAAGLFLVSDVVLLTALLVVSGAAQNPFTLLYFIPITLATVIAPQWTFRVAGLSVAGFVVLLFQTAQELGPHVGHSHHAHFFQHVVGMAVALAVAGIFVTFFVHRIARELSLQRQVIADLSREQQENRFAIALGTLSAGAAHELGSPLGTIQILADELPHLTAAEHAKAIDDMRREVHRMKEILHTMDSSELSAQVLGKTEPWCWDQLGETFVSLGVPSKGSNPIETDQPRGVVEQIARELVRNAQRVASPGGIGARLEASERELTLEVVDDGPTLTPAQLARAAQPFVSDSGGTGLGLFLATVHARQLGGRLELSARGGGGTVARLVLPPRAPRISGAALGGGDHG